MHPATCVINKKLLSNKDNGATTDTNHSYPRWFDVVDRRNRKAVPSPIAPSICRLTGCIYMCPPKIKTLGTCPNLAGTQAAVVHAASLAGAMWHTALEEPGNSQGTHLSSFLGRRKAARIWSTASSMRPSELPTSSRPDQARWRRCSASTRAFCPSSIHRSLSAASSACHCSAFSSSSNACSVKARVPCSQNLHGFGHVSLEELCMTACDFSWGNQA